MSVDASDLVRRTALAAIGGAAGLALAGVIERPWSVATAIVAAGLAAILVPSADRQLAVRSARHRSLCVVGIAVVGGAALAIAVSAAAPDRGDTRGVLGDALDGATRGWSALVTSPVPADPTARLLVPLAVAVWAATASATVLAARATTATRRAPLGALLAPLAAIVGAVVAAGREQYVPALTGAVVVAAASGFLATFRPAPSAAAAPVVGRRRRRTPARLARRLVAAATVSAIGAAIVGPMLAFGRDDEPFDPRDRLDPPTVPAGAVSPLDLFASRLRDPAQPMFVIRAGEPIVTRLVVLDTFDGARWTTSAAYAPSGSAITGAARAGIAVRRVSADITVDGLTGPWMPTAGDAVRVIGTSVLVDPASRSLIAADGEALGATYRLDADLPVPDVASLQYRPVDGGALDELQLPPNMPAPLDEMARVATAGATTPFTTAVLLQRYLQLNFGRDDDYTAGHSYGHLLRALTEIGAGTDEQFASAFAVLGRAVGLPTRVVVGFGTGEAQGDGSYVVRAGDARVWPEVAFEGAGWIAFDPSPPRDGQVDDMTVGLGGGQGFVVEEAPPAAPISGDAPPPAPPAAPDAAPSGIPWLPAILLAALAVVVGGVLAAVVTVVGKRRRTRRRRRSPDPRARVVGAWHDVLERFAEIDGGDPYRCTVDELIGGSEPAAALTGLYRPVTCALYADAACTAADAEQAWRARDRFVRARRHDVAWPRRVVWAVDPRAHHRRRHHHRRERSGSAVPPRRRSRP